MSIGVVIAVGLLGGAGAVGRVLLAEAVGDRAGSGWPYGILAVNLTGSFVLGVLIGAGLHGDGALILGTGLLGGYTTFSTWMADSHGLAAAGGRRAAAVNVVLSLGAGLLAVWLGRSLG